MTLEALKTEIEALPEEQFAELWRWMAEREWGQWDDELEVDITEGKLDFLLLEAAEAAAIGAFK